MKKKIVFSLAVSMLILVFYSLWNNILILDDFHPSEDLLDVSIDDMLEETEDAVAVTKGYYIYINLDELKLYLYKDGVLLKTYMVSGGKPETPSPEGTWKVISKSDWGGSFGGSWMGLNVPWGQYGIHGTKHPWCIGKQNASHGCIRMYNDSAKELYNIIPHGTIVTIVQKNRPFKELKSGDVGSDVLKVQKALKNLGYYHDWPSGKFQDNLKKSVIKFQKDNNIKVTGTVNKSLYNLILKKYEEKLGKDQNQ
ncbi:L,D-transpeptidase family protein [Acetivibrio mesophilus]|uniref:L,D-transpeptidase family protein n=1 Tax=Acetivibrio mesophilus TaxID=2487273 RepID=UPI001EEF2C91|nr:L,D-transpeptidase family protein [Acetivibrio mesophilus]